MPYTHSHYGPNFVCSGSVVESQFIVLTAVKQCKSEKCLEEETNGSA